MKEKNEVNQCQNFSIEISDKFIAFPSNYTEKANENYPVTFSLLFGIESQNASTENLLLRTHFRDIFQPMASTIWQDGVTTLKFE